MAKKVEGKLYEVLTGQLFEIGRQLRQKNGYPFDPDELKDYFQEAIEGNFSGRSKSLNDSSFGHFFMTVTLGKYPNVDELRQAVLESQKRITPYDSQILDETEISSERIKIDLWEVSARDLGLTKNVTRDTIYASAFRRGFEICPIEAVILACIKSEGSRKRWKIGALASPYLNVSQSDAFDLDSRGDNLWLYLFSEYPGYLWSPDDRWLFSRPRRSFGSCSWRPVAP